MRTVRFALPALLGLALYPVLAQQPKVLAPHGLTPRRVEKPFPLPPAASASMMGGPWMVDANFKSAIHLKNVVETTAVTITPVLYLSNGTRYPLPAVQLEPAGTAIIDINSSLESLGIAPYATLSGWVELQYNFPWAPVCALIRNVDTAHSLIFTYGLGAPSSSPLEGALLLGRRQSRASGGNRRRT